jgi:phosphoribosylformylglycinamidine synthase subunit PurL
VVTASAANAEKILARASSASVPAARLGATGGDALRIAGEKPLPVATLIERFETWLPAYMAGSAA